MPNNATYEKNHYSCRIGDKNDIYVCGIHFFFINFLFFINLKASLKENYWNIGFTNYFRSFQNYNYGLKIQRNIMASSSLCAISTEHQQGSQHSLIMQHHAKLLRFLHCLLPLNKTNFCIFLEQHQRFYVIFVA